MKQARDGGIAAALAQELDKSLNGLLFWSFLRRQAQSLRIVGSEEAEEACISGAKTHYCCLGQAGGGWLVEDISRYRTAEKVRASTEADARIVSKPELAKPIQPSIDILANLILGYSIALLDLAFELITSAVNCSEVVVCELAPLFFNLAGELFPASLNSIPIHWCFSFSE
jgi:hypothetical protein